MLSKMTKSSILLRTIHQNFKLQSRCRLPLLSNVSCPSLRIQNSAPIFELNKRSYFSSPKVANLEKIYTGPAGKKIFLLKIMSLTTSVTAVCLEVGLYVSDASVATKVGFSVAGLLTFSTPFLGHIILRKYVSEMYYDDTTDSYTAVVYTLLATKKYINFTMEDVKHLDVEILSTVRIKGRPMFFDPSNFTDINHYKRLLGYDKPIDLGLDDLQEDLEKLRKEKAEKAEAAKKNT